MTLNQKKYLSKELKNYFLVVIVICKGSNFSITPQTVPKLNFISSVKKGTQNLPQEHSRNTYQNKTKQAQSKSHKILTNT